METQIKKRIDWLDIAKGIAIICTIIGHSFGKNRIGVFIFSFHMPIFLSYLVTQKKNSIFRIYCIHQLDGYWRKYLNYFSFQENIKHAKLNPYIHCCINLLLNIFILLAWVGIKYMVMKIYKSSKIALTKERTTE